MQLSDKKLIFIPFNVNNNHWVLITIRITDQTASLIDPLTDKNQKETVEKVKFIANTILKNKFNKSLKGITEVRHVLQQDSISCGVLVCYLRKTINRR